MIEYRTFRNFDPPALVRLWNQAQLGRGAVQHVSNDESFDAANFSQQYFDPRGLIVAQEDGRQVGFVHAGFECESGGAKLSSDRGVICAVIVHPNYRRQGIGRELIQRAETYLKDAGVKQISAGPAPKADPFFGGLYGGAQPVGFLESDTNAAPFFTRLGYQPKSQFVVMQRSMDDRDPVNFRLSMIRRKWELALADRPDPCPWWWSARFGRLDGTLAIYCVLVPKGGGHPVAGLTVVELGLYARTWNEQAIGVCDLWVSEGQRRQGFGQTLLVEVIKRLRQETITCVTANVPESDAPAHAVFRSAGFVPIDRGVVYQAPNAAE